MSDTTLYFLKFGLLAAIYGFLWLVMRCLIRDLPRPGAAMPCTRQEPDQTSSDYALEVVAGADQVEGSGPIPLIDGLVFGGSVYCSVRLRDPFCSPRHARLLVDDAGAITLEDLDSANGTTVGSTRLQGPVPLVPGDSFSIGEVTFAVKKKP